MANVRRGIWLALMIVALAALAPAQAAAGTAAFDALLGRYVTLSADGISRVDYGRWQKSKADMAALGTFIEDQSSRPPSRLSKYGRFAYWANLYNAITLKVVLDAYPVASIRDIKSGGNWFDPKAYDGPWIEKRVTVGGRALSLDDIEHEILRPTMKDPRVHYAVNCASYGCPNLRPVAWRAETLDADLDAAARAFINHRVQLRSTRASSRCPASSRGSKSTSAVTTPV